MSDPAPASIIVPAYNAARFIEPCLAAANAAAVANGWEVIVVDDGSTDATARLAEAAGVRVVRHAESRGAAAARNHGARLAHGEILIFVDSDVVAPAGTLQALVARLHESPDVHATGAHASPRNLTPRFSAHFVALRHSHAFYTQEMRDVVGVSCFQSECGAVRREVFARIGGFPERYSHAGMEDYAFGHEMERLGYVNVLLADAAYDHHYRPLWPRCREVARRTARWLPLALRRRRFESQGMGASSRDSWSFVLSLLIGLGLVVAPFQAAGLWVATAAAAGQVVWEWPFLRFARRQHGVGMALYAWPALQVFHAAIAVGFALGGLQIVAAAFRRRTGGAPRQAPEAREAQK